MSAANPKTEPTEIPASRIMRERDDYKIRAAQEFTRAEQLERELSSARRRASDWEAIALENGERAAALNLTLARIQKAADEAPSDVERLRAEKRDALDQLAKVCLERDQMTRENARLLAKLEATQKRLDAFIDDILGTDSRDTIEEYAAGPCGIDCPDCEDGRVETFDDVYSHSSGHSTRDYTVECDHCDGTGRALR